jgi:hypothetical protein
VLENLNDIPHIHLVATLAICFVCWVLGSIVLSYVSGWHSLVERFRKDEEPESDTMDAGAFSYFIRMRSLGLYPGLLRLSSAKDALFISATIFCRPGHPPLRIPWNEIRLGEGGGLWGWHMMLTLGNEERVRMRISSRAARDLGLM